MPPTNVLLRWEPFPVRGLCPVCRSPYDDQIEHRPGRQPLPDAERLARQSPHCALGHVEAFRPNFRDVIMAPPFGWYAYGGPLREFPHDELVIRAGDHFDGLPYPDPEAQAMHAHLCPWAAGTGQHPRFFDKPNWPLSPDYEERAQWADLDPVLVAFLAPVVSEEMVRAAFSSAAAGRIALAVEDGNWLAAVFAGRWAYYVRVRRNLSGRPDLTRCDCFRPDPCVHAIATWIVWAAGTVRWRSRPLQPLGTMNGGSAR